MMGQILAAQSGRRIAIDRQVDKIRLSFSLVSYTEGSTASARGGKSQVFIRRDKFGPQPACLYFQAFHLTARPLGKLLPTQRDDHHFVAFRSLGGR